MYCYFSLIRPSHYSDHVMLEILCCISMIYSSIGMALAAMEAMNNLNLFGNEVICIPCCLLCACDRSFLWHKSLAILLCYPRSELQ